MKNFFYQINLIFISIFNSFYNTTLFLFELLFFLPNTKLIKIYLNLLSKYFYKDPYIISTEEGRHINTARENLIYGETTLYGIYKILKFINPNENCIFYDLGCGTGKVVFFVNSYFNIKAIGIDIIPTFIKIANEIKQKFDLKEVEFKNEDFLKSDISDGDIFYIAGTCFDDDMLEAIINKLNEAKLYSFIISVSNPLNCSFLHHQKTFSLPFSWGKGTVYIYQKII